MRVPAIWLQTSRSARRRTAPGRCRERGAGVLKGAALGGVVPRSKCVLQELILWGSRCGAPRTRATWCRDRNAVPFRPGRFRPPSSRRKDRSTSVKMWKSRRCGKLCSAGLRRDSAVEVSAPWAVESLFGRAGAVGDAGRCKAMCRAQDAVPFRPGRFGRRRAAKDRSTIVEMWIPRECGKPLGARPFRREATVEVPAPWAG